MHVIITCKYEKDRIKNSREKVATPFFPLQPYLLPWKPVVGSGQISNSSKLSCMSVFPASMKWIRSRTAEKKWQHRFTHYKSMGIFSDAQGQLTPQSVIGSGRISNSSELSCMSSLPASMKRIGKKTAEKKWQHCFSIITLSVAMETSSRIWPNFKLFQALMYAIITCKYEKDPIKNSREKVETPFFPL